MTAFSKTDLPQKVYLSGADCFHLVLDKHAKKHGAGGNVMRKVFYFNNRLSFDKINDILTASPVIYWLCNIKLVQGSLLKLPYWTYRDEGRQIILRQHEHEAENMIPESILERDITAEAERFIEADLVYYPSGTSALVISWNHILLDARGTTLLFSHLNSISEQGAIELSNLFPEKEKKPNIIRYIFNMYKVKAFIRKSSRPPISAVAAGKDLSVQKLTSTKIISFGIDDSKKINENAVKTGSRFGPTLFFIACCSKVINFLQKNRNMPGDLWLPVPYDGRLKGAQGPLISNCVHFLFYRLTDSVLQQVPQTVKNLQEQMTSQIKRRMPQRYTMFLNMMRHIPLWLYYFLISRTGKGVMASFLYTSTGDNFNELRSLFGENIRSINLIPALTYPPGLTFVFLKHDETLHINIAYSPDIITNNELFLIEEKLKETLLYNY